MSGNNEAHKLSHLIEKTFLLKLTETSHKIEKPEYSLRKNMLSKNVSQIRNQLKCIDLLTNEKSSEIIASLIILCKELTIKADYNPKNAREYLKLLNSDFETEYGVTLDNLLKIGKIFDSQSIFDYCMDKLHHKVTADNYKLYPSLIEVYQLIIKEVKSYNVSVIPMKTLPISLILIDDHTYRIKGLKCCTTILKCSNSKSFESGNYHEVIYISLLKALKIDDMDVTKPAMLCYKTYINALPPDLKKQKSDEIMYVMIKELPMMSVDRKQMYLKFLQPLITIDLVKRQKSFKAIILDTLDECSLESSRKVVLEDVLECLKLWIKHCWCAWHYPTDYKILSALLRILAILTEKETKYAQTVQELVMQLINISDSKHQKEILVQLKQATKLNNKLFVQRITSITSNYNISEIHKKKS